MDRAYYKVTGGEMREKAIEIQKEIHEARGNNKARLKDFSKEFGCKTSYYEDPRTTQISALNFEKISTPLNMDWKQVDGTNGWMPKRNSKEGRELYKKIAGPKVRNTDNAIPKEECFGSKFSGMRMYWTTCSVLSFSEFGEDDVVILTVPYDELKMDEPEGIPTEISKHLVRMKPREMQAEYDRFNEMVSCLEKESA